MSEGGQQPPPLEIQVVDWDADAETFTIEGMNPQLEELLLRQRVTPHILLRRDMVLGGGLEMSELHAYKQCYIMLGLRQLMGL
jgi:hypothetical protein